MSVHSDLEISAESADKFNFSNDRIISTTGQGNIILIEIVKSVIKKRKLCLNQEQKICITNFITTKERKL